MRRAWVIVSLVAIVALAVAASIIIAGLPGRVLAPDSTPGSAPDAAVRLADDDELGTVEVYDVLPDGSLDPVASGRAGEVWDAFLRVASREFVGDVVAGYTVGDADGTDLLALVSQDVDDPRRWHLTVNLAGANDLSYLLTTLIHEFAHILTLDVTQLPANGECEVEFRSEDCWYGDAYLAVYWEEFWSGYGADAPESWNASDGIATAFYAAHEDDFVSSYAAMNVVEDIAESFMAYVIEPVPDPSLGVVAAKLAFFDRFPELAAIRERIRADFGDVLRPAWDE